MTTDNYSDGTDRSVPTEGEDELMGTLEEVQRTGKAPCRLCDELVDVSDAENWGDVFEALADHGEEAHDWDDTEGWQRTQESATERAADSETSET